MRSNYIITAVLLLVLAFMNACKNKEIDIETFKIEDYPIPSATSVSIEGYYSFSGNVIGMRVVYGLEENLAGANSKKIELEGTDFSVTIGDLISDTTYYYCYSVDLGGATISYTPEPNSFTTLAAAPEDPIVQVVNYLPVDEDNLEFRVECKVSWNGGAKVTERGICYNIHRDPRVAAGDPTKRDSLGSGTDTGTYYVYMKNLVPGKTYYVRAYAKNEAGNLGESEGVLKIETASPQGTTVEIGVSASPEGGGSVTGGGNHLEGSVIELMATASPGYSFDHWQDGSHANPHTITVTADTTYTAYFTQVEYEIMVRCQPVNGGTASGGGTFHYGDTATLTASANNGYEFAGWSDGNTDNLHEVIVTDTATYTAVFRETGAVYYNVIIHVVPEGAGTVPGGPHEAGSQIYLNATPNEGYHFEKWGDGITDNPRQIMVNADMELTAIFEKNTYTITVNSNQTNGGTVSGGGQYQYGETATLTATPTDDCFKFIKWSDGSIANPRHITVNADMEFTAIFEKNTYTITVTPGTGGTAHVGSSSGPTSQDVDCGANCTIYAVVANEHYEFDNWTEDDIVVSSYANYTFTVNANRNLVANFTYFPPTYTVNVSTNPTNGGNVNGGGTYTNGHSCTVTATPNTNYTFANWTENGTVVSTNASYNFTVTGNRTLVANFTYVPPTYTISVSANPTYGGNVSGGGTYTNGHSCTVTATPNTNYTFANWTENETVVSSNASYTFTVNANRDLVANFTYNGGNTHEYVDLGLPSGLLWATCNVGADNPEDYGDYFAWGETQTKDDYSWSTYQYCMGSQTTLTKYCNESNCGNNGFTDDLTTLEPSDDAATINWGNGWRMPTQAEWNELLNNTTNIWTTQNGVNGRLFTATNGNSLFLPAAGYRNGTHLGSAGSNGFYWSSSLFTGNPGSAMYFYFELGSYFMIGSYRTYGQSVRAVRSSRQN